jgi:MFS family permease
MIFPLLPLFVTEVLSAGPAFFGLLDGIAESLSSVVKLLAGALSDRLPRRRPFVIAGYGLAVFSRSAFVVATAPWHAMCARAFDRLGKGIRTAPRDALLAASSARAGAEAAASGLELEGAAATSGTTRRHGLTFGFHRGMDHLGAAAGSAIAAVLLAWGASLRVVFAAAVIPGLLALVVVSSLVRESGDARAASAPLPWVAGGPRLGRDLRGLLLAVAVFTLGNSSDGFIMLLATRRGFSEGMIPVLWAALHLIKGATTLAGGVLSDRLGRARVLLVGWLLYAAVYAGFASSESPWMFTSLTLAYGCYFGMTEGVVAALVADLAPPAQRGKAFGAFHLTTGLGTLPASAAMGWLWQRYGAPPAFWFSAVAACVGAGLLWRAREGFRA